MRHEEEEIKPLPAAYLKRMEQMLGADYADFLKSYQAVVSRGLRLNTLKGASEQLLRQMPFSLQPVPWCRTGYYYDKDDRPGRHPYHDAGLYYMQEASAMAPAEYMQARPKERVLDLCAAPGGKSTQLAAAMEQQGILFCNEIHPARAKILSENIERMGIRNAVVTNETPDRLAQVLKGFFDRVLVDAPCSGEGMFRRNPEARSEWSEENVRLCGRRQDEILAAAARLLRPGGCLVYSTCTFAPWEDEGTILRFLREHEEFRLAKTKLAPGQEPGQACWAEEGSGQASQAGGAEEGSGQAAQTEEARGRAELGLTIRLWPHKLRGEGHFVAVLEKAPYGSVTEARSSLPDQEAAGEGSLKRPKASSSNRAKEVTPKASSSVHGKEVKRYKTQKGLAEKKCREYLQFREQNLRGVHLEGLYLQFGDQLYLAPEGTPPLAGLKVLRPGLHLGTVKKGRFEPSHALALTLRPGQAAHVLDLPADSDQMQAYLAGMTLQAEGEKGWYLITADGFGIGWGKLSGSTMKNHYPRGLRKNGAGGSA